MDSFTFTPIGKIHSPYKEKFAIPRQPNLINEGVATLELSTELIPIESVRELSQFSHLWILSVFHKTVNRPWHPTVRPPRLGGNSRVGLFATRSPFRPNPIALSLVELRSISYLPKKIVLHLSSIDLLDDTPVLDIKPYLPFAESIPLATAGFAQLAPDSFMQVRLSDLAEQQVKQAGSRYPNLRLFLIQVLQQDPRPAYKQRQESIQNYAAHLYEF